MLGSAIRSAVASATPAAANPPSAIPASATPASANPATASAAASAAASTPLAAAPTGSQPQPPQPGSNPRAPASASGSASPESLLAQPVMQQVSRALMHVIGPLVTVQAAAPPSTSADASAGAAAVSEAGRPGPSQDPPAAAGTSSTTSNPRRDSSRSATQRPLGMSEPLSEMIGPALSEPRAEVVSEHGAADEHMGAGASSPDDSGPSAVFNQPGATSATPAAGTDTAQAPTAASLPSASAEASAAPAAAGNQSSSKPAEASGAAAGSGGQRPSQRAMGLGSALPSREKGSKKSHPRSSLPNTSPNSPDEAAAGSRQAGSRPGPSVPEQDNVKRARHGDTTSDPPSRSAAGTDVQKAASATAGLHEEEEIPRPSRGAVQAGSAGGLDAMLAQMFGGGVGAAGGTGSGGLNLNSLVQVRPHMHLLPAPAG